MNMQELQDILLRIREFISEKFREHYKDREYLSIQTEISYKRYRPLTLRFEVLDYVDGDGYEDGYEECIDSLEIPLLDEEMDNFKSEESMSEWWVKKIKERDDISDRNYQDALEYVAKNQLSKDNIYERDFFGRLVLLESREYDIRKD